MHRHWKAVIFLPRCCCILQLPFAMLVRPLCHAVLCCGMLRSLPCCCCWLVPVPRQTPLLLLCALCRAVLCCGCCVMLCCAVLCCIKLRFDMLLLLVLLSLLLFVLLLWLLMLLFLLLVCIMLHVWFTFDHRHVRWWGVWVRLVVSECRCCRRRCCFCSRLSSF